MSNLGTLWFGADIDISKLKQKINRENQGILDALKLNYDPQSYQQMVNKLKSQLANEKFDIKISASGLTQNALGKGMGSKGAIGVVDELNDKVNKQKALIADLEKEVAKLEAAYNKLKGGERYNRLQDAKAELKIERANLNKLNADRQAYNNTLRQTAAAKRQAAAAARQLNSDSIRLNTTLAGGIHISTRLGSALSGLFAVHTARQFLDSVIEIGGQLEKQRISMGAIIGDTARANELFENIKDLAIKSPFGVVELDQYSKQLAAYGIEQSNLFDMTKRLADISAGAGQDISRIALALGHVKSATYLTGITLRQFSMNNIPMLKMLADYYTEIENRAVSTAEVQKRISKRQVSYEDVVEQIKRMTDADGMFYNMQEKISESLQAKFKNLRDSFDIMYGEIAESSVGDALKALAAILTSMSRNWKEFMTILGSAALLWGTYRLSLIPVNTALRQFGTTSMISTTRLQAQRIAVGLNSASLKTLSAATIDTMVKEGMLSRQHLLNAVATKRLTVAQAELAASTFNISRAQLIYIASAGRLGLAMRTLSLGARSLGIALKGLMLNPFTIAITAFTGMLEVFMHFKNKNEEAQQSIRDTINTANEGFSNLKDVSEKYSMDFGSIDKGTMLNGIKEISEAIKNYAPNANNILNQAAGIDTLTEKYKYLRLELESTKNAYADMEQTADIVINANSNTEGRFDDSFFGNVKDYISDLKDAGKAEQDFAYHRIAISKTLENLAKYSEEFNKQRFNDNGSLKTLQEQIDILKKINIPNMGSGLSVFASSLRTQSVAASVAFNEWNQAMSYADKTMKNDVLPDLDDFSKKINAAYAGKWGENWKQNGDHVKTALIQVTKELEKIPDMTDKVKNDLLNEIFNKRWHLNIDFTVSEAKETLTGWQKEMQEYFDENNIYIRLSMQSSREDVIKQIGEERKNAQAVADNAGKVLIGIGFKLDSLPEELPAPLQTPWNQDAMDSYNNSTKYINALNEAIKKYNLNVTEKGKKGNSKPADQWLKNMREQLKELENFYKVYKRNAQYMSKDDAIQKALDSDVFKGKNLPKNIDDYLKVLQDFRKKVESEIGKKPSTERKSFLTDLLTKIDEKEFEVKTKEVFDNAAKRMEEYIQDNADKFNLYKILFEKTGSKSFAMSAFSDGKIWDDLTTNLADNLREKMGDKSALIDWDADKIEAEKWFKDNFDNGEELYKLWLKIVELISGNYKKSLEDAADAFKESMTYAERIAAIQAKYTDKNKTATSDRERYANKKAEEKEIAEVKLDEFKDKINWDAVFGNLKLYTRKALVETRKSLRDYLKLNRNKMDVKQIKDVEGALTKLDDVIADKSLLFVGLIDSIKAYREATEELTAAEKEYNETVTQYGANSIQAQEAKRKYNQAQNNANNAYANVKGSRDATLNKIAQISNSLVNIGKSNEASLTDVGNVVSTVVAALGETGEGIGALIAAIFALLDSIGEQGLDRFLGNILDSVGHAYGGILKGVGNIVGSLWGNSHLGDSIFGDFFATGYERYEEAKGEYENLISVWDSLIEKKRTYLNQAWGTEAENAGKEALALLEAEKEATKIMAEQRLSSGASLGSHSIRYRMWEGSYDYKGTNWQDVAGEISAALGGVRFDEMSDMLNMTGEQLLWIKENYVGLWAHMDDDFKEYLEKLIQYGDQAEDIIKKAQEKLTGWDLDAVKSEWADLMSDMDNSSDALADNLEEKLRNAILNSMISNLFTKRLQALIDSAGMNDLYVTKTGVIKSHTYDEKGNVIDTDVASEYTQDEMAAIMGEAESLGDEVTAIRDMLKDMYGWETSGSSTASKVIQGGFTEDETGLLLSYTNAIRADVSLERAEISLQLPVMASNVERMSALSQTQVTLQEQIASNTLRSANAADEIYNLLHKLAPDGQRMRVQ